MGTHTVLLFVCLVAGLRVSMAEDSSPAPSPPTSLNVTIVRYDTVSISWEHEGSVDYYNVNMKSFGTQTDFQYNISANNNEKITRYFTFKPPVTYIISVSTVLGGVRSAAVSSPLNLPLPVPKIESLSEEKETTLNITWTQEGRVTQFNIHIESADTKLTYSEYLDAPVVAYGSHSGNYTYSVDVRPGYRYNVSIAAFFHGSASDDSEIQTFIAAGEKQEENSTASPGTSKRCYECRTSNCGIARTSADVKQECPKNHACWMHRQVDSIIRRCETKACSAEFHTWKRVTEGSTITYSKCCTGDLCNGELVSGSSRLVFADFPLMISSILMVLTSLFIMA